MIKGKRVYTVRGSEDGNLGVYTNFKLAHKKAIEYLGSTKIQDGLEKYSKALAEVRKYGRVDIEGQDTEWGYDSSYAYINEFGLNE